jgi:hypothetical protein
MASERPNVGGPRNRSTADPNAARRKLAARIGGIALHLRHDSNQIAAHARAGLLARFERLADPEHRLGPEARAARAKLMMRQHMTRLALASIEARRRRVTRKRARTPTVR